MSQHRKSVSILCSSSTANGARNVDISGGSFQVTLNDAIQFPPNAQNITVECTKATVWNTISNFKTTNNQIFVSAQDTLGVVITRVITLPVGLYDVSTFKAALLGQLLNEGFKQSPTPVLDVVADYATSKIGIVLNYTNTSISFTLGNGVLNPMNKILGFDLGTYATGNAPFVQYAPNVAKFNQLNSILVVSNLSDNGFAVNNREANVIAQILINVQPGSQIIFEPFNPTQVSASNLAGSNLKEFNVRITDENLQTIDTNYEEFTVLFKISYTIIT
jgi:hypothetical protein